MGVLPQLDHYKDHSSFLMRLGEVIHCILSAAPPHPPYLP